MPSTLGTEVPMIESLWGSWFMLCPFLGLDTYLLHITERRHLQAELFLELLTLLGAFASPRTKRPTWPSWFAMRIRPRSRCGLTDSRILTAAEETMKRKR